MWTAKENSGWKLKFREGLKRIEGEILVSRGASVLHKKKREGDKMENRIY